MDAGNLCELRIELLVIVYAVGARLGEADVRGYAQKTVLQSFAETGVHRQGDDKRGYACGYSNDGEQSYQSQDGGPVRRAQITPRDQPFKSHGVAPEPRGLGGAVGFSGVDSFAEGAPLRS